MAGLPAGYPAGSRSQEGAAVGRRHRRGEPVPRSRSGPTGRRFERTGTEPITAQSAVRLRLLLSLLFLPLFAALTVIFAVWWANAEPVDSPSPGSLRLLTLVCAGLTLIALVDLVVIVRRLRRERGDAGW